jgi:hypothetical protein
VKAHQALGPASGLTVRLIYWSVCLLLAHWVMADASPAGGLSAEIIQILPVSEKNLMVLMIACVRLAEGQRVVAHFATYRLRSS